MEESKGYKIINNVSEFEFYKDDDHGYFFKRVIFNFKIDLSNNVFGKITMSDCVFKCDLICENSTFKNGLVIHNSFFESDITFVSTVFYERADFYQVYNAHRILFSESSFLCGTNFYLKYNEKYDYDIVDVNFMDCKFESTLRFRNRAKDISSKAEAFLINFNRVDFKEGVSISSSGMKAPLLLNNSVFHKSFTFGGFYDYVVLENTLVLGLLTLDDLEIIDPWRETVSKIKNWLLQANNRIDAIKYHALEMRLFYKNTYHLSRILKLLSKSHFQNVYKKDLSIWQNAMVVKGVVLQQVKPYFESDFLLLSLLWYSNKFGLSWVRGICFTLIVGWLFFILVNTNLDEPMFVWGLNGWDSFTKVCVEYRNFLYPVRSLDALSNFNPNIKAVIFDFLGRIFVGFGYYQTIQAFRKYGKL